MKLKIILTLAFLISLLSCVETKVNPDAMNYSRQGSVSFTVSARPQNSGNTWFIGDNNYDMGTSYTSSQAFVLGYSGCITSYNFTDHSDFTAAMAHLDITINNSNTLGLNIDLDGSNSGAGVLNQSINPTDEIAVRVVEGATGGGEIADFKMTLHFGQCN